MPPAAAPAPNSKMTAPPAPAVLGTRNSPSFSKVSTPLNLILVEQPEQEVPFSFQQALWHYTRILRIPSPDTIAFPLSVVQIQAYEASATVDYVVRGG